ncbi:prepilin-type N-terminal cleavage/methylation domain-containing protein [uncultured Gemmiger sp.]|uniref:prepilin-type N-terminal cleavage/methylation domain-containing protein n=2 Tax=uncultured Gemmiger sp. TaxID=1623490 RepID=UPI00265E79BF|nr:prepilin-type N-terminal cleavage/methylation domain-containing protein [uncultured Gemmiger sp.]
MTGLRRPLRDRRGFTLVELIVVLVILGVLATFAVPALTGYIDSAKEKQAVSEAQACVMAATRLGAAQYAKVQQHNVNVSLNSGAGAAKDDSLDNWAPVDGQSAPEITGGDVALTEGSGQYLLHVTDAPAGSFPGDVSAFTTAAEVDGSVKTLTFNSNGQLLYLVYTSTDGIQVVYTNAGTTASVNIGSDEAVVVPTPKKNDNSGGGETGGGSTGGGISGGSTTGSTATADEHHFIIHLQDVKTANSKPFANRKYRIKSGENGENAFDVTSDNNGDILLKISPKEKPLPDTVIGDTETTITEAEVPDGYQVIPSSTKIYISVWFEGNDYYLKSIEDDRHNNPFAIDMDKRQLTIMRFPIAKLNLRVTDPEGKALSGATFAITNGKTTVAELTSDSKGECSIPVKLHDGDNIGYSAACLTTGDQNHQTYNITEICPPEGYQGGFTCSFHLYYKAYPSTPTPHYTTWFRIDAFNGTYSLESTVGEQDTFHVTNKKL